VIRITSSERVLFVGATGSGKTVLAKWLLASLRRVLVIDPKHTFSLDGFLYADRLPFWLPWQRQEFQIITRPSRGDDEKLRNLVESVYFLGNATIFVDELASLADRFPLTLETLEDIARTGREKRVSLWNAVQRPRWTPKIFMTETESFFVFGLRAEEDRQYLAGFVGKEVTEIKLAKHEFLYCRSDANTAPERLRLNLDSDIIVKSER